jgi:hypothetical protein
MTETLSGYARCSTDAQDLTAQRDRLRGVPEEGTYLDHGLTGTSRKRPAWTRPLAAVREGDTVVVPKLDLFARSLPDAPAIGDGPNAHFGYLLTVRPMGLYRPPGMFGRHDQIRSASRRSGLSPRRRGSGQARSDGGRPIPSWPSGCARRLVPVDRVLAAPATLARNNCHRSHCTSTGSPIGSPRVKATTVNML